MENFKKKKNIELIIALFFILIGFGLRLLPHPPNFAPIAAIALFGAVYLPKRTALALPIIAMLASDAFIGFYEIKIMAVVYASFILTGVLGFWLKKHKKPETIFYCAVFSSLIFFILTNFAVFVFSPLYEKNLSGFLQCYLMALPFFRNSLLSDLFYTAIFFGAFELAKVLVDKKFGVKEEIPCKPAI
ncbi:MAG: hypothetical protein HYT36_03150 [Candidatus Staskawiczbacteria bacterium]|nr:hypothetical protein [Candidatus Staskawiczbacteria bacterium]